MAAALTPTLINKDFQNWLKGALAVLFAKEGLIDLVGHENIDFQNHLLQTLYTQKGIPPGTTCSSCTTANVLSCPTAGFCSKGKRCKTHDSNVPDKKPNQVCPNSLCSHIRDAIRNEHRFKGPSWINTDARRWCSDAFQLSKCFMPPDGYSDKTCLADTDFNGILAVVINNNRFQRKMSVNLGLEPNICTEARIIGREIRHSANHLLSDRDLMKYIDDLITLLSDPAYLAADVKANDAVGKLKQLKTNTLTLHADDITNVLNESIKTTFDDQQKLFLHDIQEHFKRHKNDSVEVIDRKIQEFVDKRLAELKAQTDRGKDELNAEKDKGKTELKLQSQTSKVELQTQLEHGKGKLNSKVEKGKVELGAQIEQGKDEINSKVEKGMDELSAQIGQGKAELNSKVEKGKGELSAQIGQGKDELSSNVKKGKGELSAQIEQGKDELNLKVKKGKDKLSAQIEQRKDELNLKVEKGKLDIGAKTEQGLDELHAQIRQGANELKVQTSEGKDELSSHIVMGKHEVEAKTNQGKEEIEARGKQVLEEISMSAVLKTGNNDDSLLQDLKEDIITYYREHESVIPASPLVDEHNVPIEDLYVLPPMWAYKDSYFGQDKNRQKGDKKSGNDGQDKQEITVSGLFLSGAVRYRKIYITANAGFGKTSLSQKLTMTWCQSQSPLESLAENYEETELTSKEGNLVSEEDELDSQETDLDFEGTDLDSEETDLVFEETELDSEETDRDFEETDQDSVETDFDSDETDQDSEEYKQESEKAAKDTLRYFDLLFLLHLRDYQCESKCNLDDLIIKMVSDKLSRSTQYTKEFLQRSLHKKNCLIILDGLDEWAHPGHCTRKPEVPHNNHPDSCTVLTTTRDWKIGTVGLSPKDIDRRVEISMLDDKTRTELEKNAIRILNEKNLNLAGKNIADFDKEVNKFPIGNIIYIPYILLQLMCLFFGGLPIGKSKCEIYSNITEFTLKRGLKKKDLPDIHVQTNDNAAVPNCLKQNKKCNLYFNPVMKLGKLAFCALFSDRKESSLIFDRKYAKQYMTKQEIDFFLKVGLLCQTKDSSIIAVKRYHVFFQHKSVQEFFSAIYITSEWQNETVKLTILNVCSSLSGILEMYNVFVFVCGMNPEVYTCISGELQTIVDLDDVTRRYRTYMDSDDAERAMLSYQSMQVQCLQECVRNGNDSCSIHLHDYILTEEDLKSLNIIINFNKGNVKSLQLSNVKSLQLSDPDKYTFMQSLDPGVFTSLETLRVERCDKEPVWLADILTESVRTLKCLTLPGYNISLSDISITALTGLTCLQSLYLAYVHMTHSNLKSLYAYISQTTTLTQLKLKWIRCSDHEDQYRDCDVTLDLHRPNELKMLHLEWVPCRELHVNPACLEKLEFRSQEEKMTARARAILWQDLRAAPVLSSLKLSWMTSCQEMIQTIPTLTQLQHLKLVRIDMGDVIPRVSPEMTHLERVELLYVTMSSAAWQTLFFSIGQLPQSITVKLTWIGMTSQEWRELLLSVGGLQHPVTVELYRCHGPSEEDWRTIVNVIKTTPTLSLLHDLRIDWLTSLTLKNKTV